MPMPLSLSASPDVRILNPALELRSKLLSTVMCGDLANPKRKRGDPLRPSLTLGGSVRSDRMGYNGDGATFAYDSWA